MVERAREYSDLAAAPQTILAKSELSDGIDEFTVHSPLIARAARAGQFVRVLPRPDGELIPLTLADWDADAGTISLVVQGVGTSSIEINQMSVGEAFTGIAGPLGRPSDVHRHDDGSTVVFTAGGLGLPPAFPIIREHLAAGNHVTLVSGFRSRDLMFWTGAGRAGGPAAGRVRRPARRRLHDQRRVVRRAGVRDRARSRRCSRRTAAARAARSPRS